MTKLVLIRHGEPDYSFVTEKGFKGHGRDLAQLTAAGIEQAKAVAKDKRLDGAEKIVASPYTRTLQTAAIISKERGLDIDIELDIHEWLPDLTFNFSSTEEALAASHECTKCKGTYDDNDKRNWEKLSSVSERAFNCMKKYLNYNKIIVVTHGVIMRQFQYQNNIPYCGIIEVDFHENYQWCGWVEE